MYVLFDIGGTNMRIATSDGTSFSEPTILPTPQDFDEGMNMLRQTVQTIVGDANIECVAGGIAGALNHEKSRLLNSPNLKNWEEKPLKKSLQDLFTARVSIENDAVVVGLGEAMHGAGRDHSIVVYVTISTGVGGVRIVDGVVEPNESGYEPGHQVVDINSTKTCKCGGQGHLESFIGGGALKETYGIPPEEITDESVWDTLTKIAAVGLNNMSVHWSPQIIVLGGAISQKLDLELLTKYFKQRLTIFKHAPKLSHASLGDTGGLYGALSLAERS